MALGGGSRCCWPLSLDASASVSALAPFPVPAHRTGLADFPHPALRPASPHRCRRRRPQLRPAQAQHAHLLLRFEAELAPELPDPNGVARLIANRLVLSLVDKHAGSQGPSLHRHYPASSLLRPCPTPLPSRRPVDNVWSCDLRPVGPPAFDCEHPSASCRAHYPGGPNRCTCRSLLGLCGLPRFSGGSASATSLSRPAQAYFTLRPNGLLARPCRTLSRGFNTARYRIALLASFDVDRHLHRRGLSPHRVFAPVRRTENSRVPLTTDPAEDTAPTWSPDGRRVAFLRRDRTAGTASVMFVPSVGGNPRVVVRRSFFGAGTTPVLNQAARPLSWHPDSEHLLALLPESDSTQPELQVVNVETGSTRKLFAGENEGRDNDPAVSPDGRLLAFRRGTTYADGIYVVELTDTIEAAGEPRKVSGVLPGFAPAWSHDSQKLVFAAGVTEGARLWRVAARGGEARVVQHPSMGAFPAISPAGGRAAFALITRNVDIWQAQLPGMTDQKPLIESTLFDVTPQYSPDGERIAFSSARSGYREIWVCDQDGSGAIQLTQLESRISSMPQWSPDGSRIVFQSYVGDQLDIFTMPSGGGKAEQLTEHPGMDFQPSWSRDGEWIYFSSDRSGQPSIWKTPATGGDSVQVTSEPGRYAVESPDGQTLYFVGPEALQAVPVRGGAAESLVEGRMYADGISIADVGVYMMREARSVLDFYDFRSKKVRRVFEFPGTVFSTISVSPDGKTILFAPIEPPESDIMLIDEFR